MFSCNIAQGRLTLIPCWTDMLKGIVCRLEDRLKVGYERYEVMYL
jgi:hypothetical protein